jgi:hypothetical protein
VLIEIIDASLRANGPCTQDAFSPGLAAWCAGRAAGLAGAAFGVRERVTAPAASAVLGQTTVRKQHNYMTRTIAFGDGAPGPHRWRVPV